MAATNTTPTASLRDSFRAAISERERSLSQALADHKMVRVGDLADYAAGRIPGPAFLWLGGFDRFAEIASVNADYWVTEGRGVLTSSWCCHAGTAVYRRA